MAVPRCGTVPGYQAHQARAETACDECKAALATYARGWRARNPEAMQRLSERKAAERRVVKELIAMYPEDYADLMAKEGIYMPRPYGRRQK